MGYAHYWTRKGSFTDQEWRTITAAFGLIVEAAIHRGSCLSVRDGGSRISTHGRLRQAWHIKNASGPVLAINGVDAQRHETFQITKDVTPIEPWMAENIYAQESCKTSRKPYDLVVTAMLSWLEHHFPDHIEVFSDGALDEWREGIDLARQVTGAEVTGPSRLVFSAAWPDKLLQGSRLSLRRNADGDTIIEEDYQIHAHLPSRANEDWQAIVQQIQQETSALYWAEQTTGIDLRLQKLTSA